MGAVGLLYVGAVLFLNGVTLLGKIDPKSAGVFNLFVGALQVVTPTFLIFTAAGDPDILLNASGIYLFGFTYLYVGIGLLARLDTTGVGWFSLFVAVAAVGYSFANFRSSRTTLRGHLALLGLPVVPVLPVVRLEAGWPYHLHGLGDCDPGLVTGAIPAFLLLTGYWADWNQTGLALALGIFGVVMALVLLPLTHPRAHAGVVSGAGTPATGRP